jgi:hypothetical protein
VPASSLSTAPRSLAALLAAASLAFHSAARAEPPALPPLPAAEPPPRAAPASSLPPLVVAPFVVIQGRLSAEPKASLDDDGAPSAELRRLRLGARIRTADDRLRVFLHASASQASPEMIDAFVDHRLGSFVLRWGQAKVPFSAYRQEQFFELPTSDWAHLTKVFGAERQLGAQALFEPGPAPGWYGALGLFQGTTLRTAHGQGVAPLYGEASFSFTDLRRSASLDPVHPEVVARVGRRLVRHHGLLLDLETSFSIDARPLPARDLRHAAAIEAHAEIGALSSRAIVYAGLADLVETHGSGVVSGFLAQARLALAHDGPWITAEFSQFAWAPALQRDALARSARLLAEASDKDRSAVAKAHSADGRSAGQWVALLALRHNVRPYLALTAEIARSAQLRILDDPGSYRVRLQTQIAF